MVVRRCRLLFSLAAALPLAAQENPPQAVPLPAQGDQSTDNEMPATQADGLALARLGAIHRHQIASAEIARRKNPGQPLADFAKALFDDHTAWLERSREIARAIGAGSGDDEPTLRTFETGRETRRDALDDLQGEEFERAWLQQTLVDHADALAAIDAALRSARNDDVVTHLRALRGNIAAQLERARQLAAAPEA